MDALSCNTEAGLFTDILPKMYQIWSLSTNYSLQYSFSC
jgi:hypothetical protein